MKRAKTADGLPGTRVAGSATEDCVGRIRVREEGRGKLSMELFGELDVATAGGLREILVRAATSGRFVVVDLCRVSFMDSSCLRELVVQKRLRPGRVALCDPSPQVELSAAACGVEASVHFCSAVRDRGEAVGAPHRAGEGGCW